MGEIIPFPVWIIPFPVLKINLELIGENEKCFTKKFFHQWSASGTKSENS